MALCMSERKYFFGVARSGRWSRLKPGDESYWCVFRTYAAQTGDYLILYKVGQGVTQFFQLTDSISPDGELNCER